MWSWIFIAVVAWFSYSLIFDSDADVNNKVATKTKQSQVCIEPVNPYSEGYNEGHYRGFEWAERKGVSSCGGNSDSFVDGCEEYIRQQMVYDNCASGR